MSALLTRVDDLNGLLNTQMHSQFRTFITKDVNNLLTLRVRFF
jgi:hypothetical protein